MTLAIRSPFRMTLATLAALAAMLAATGIVQIEAFQYPSNLKYALTILAPLAVFLACTIERPLWLFSGAMIVAAPFMSENAQFAGMRVSVIVPLLLAAGSIAMLSERPRGRTGGLAVAGVLAFPLLLVPLALGSDNHPFITTLALLLAVAWVVCRTAEEPGGMQVVIGAVAVSATLQGAIAIWQRITGHQLNLYSAAGTAQFAKNYFYTYGTSLRPTGSLPDPISLGNVLAIAMPPIAAMAVRAKTWSLRISLIAAVVIVGTGLVLTLSRMSWIGAFAGLIIGALLLPRPSRRAVLPMLVAGVVGVGIAGTIIVGPSISGRVTSILHPTSTTGVSADQKGVAAGDQNRLEYWKVAVDDAFLRHPIAGIGIDNMAPFIIDRVATTGAGIRTGTITFIHAHSTYFQLLGEGGLFALTLLVLLLRGMYRDVRDGLLAHPILGAGLAGGVVALLICWTTDWVIRNSPVAAAVAVLLGALAGAGRIGRQRKLNDTTASGEPMRCDPLA